MSALIPIDLRVYRFHPDNLDPIAVYVEQFGAASSRITVQCWARSWTAYWGSHGEAGVEQFVIRAHADYVAENLTWGLNGRILKAAAKNDFNYLLRIVRAIQNEFARSTQAAIIPGDAS